VEERYQSEESSGDVGLTPSAVSEVGFDRSVDAVAVMAAAAAGVSVAAVAVAAVAVVAATVAAVDTFSATSVFEPASILLQ